MFEKTAISASQIVDKTENAKNNEIKILVLPPDSLKSRKTVFSDNLVHKYLRKGETQASFRFFRVYRNFYPCPIWFLNKKICIRNQHDEALEKTRIKKCLLEQF